MSKSASLPENRRQRVQDQVVEKAVLGIGRTGECAAWTGIVEHSAVKFAQKFTLVHAVLEGFAAVDEDDGNFVGELAAQLIVGVDVHVPPGEAATALELGERLFHDLAEVAAFAGVKHDLAGVGHQAGV